MLRAWPPRSGYCMLLFYDFAFNGLFRLFIVTDYCLHHLAPIFGYDIHQVKLGGNFLIAAAIQSLSEVPFTASQLSVSTMFFAARSEENLERTDRFGGFVCGFFRFGLLHLWILNKCTLLESCPQGLCFGRKL